MPNGRARSGILRAWRTQQGHRAPDAAVAAADVIRSTANTMKARAVTLLVPERAVSRAEVPNDTYGQRLRAAIEPEAVRRRKFLNPTLDHGSLLALTQLEIPPRQAPAPPAATPPDADTTRHGRVEDGTPE